MELTTAPLIHPKKLLVLQKENVKNTFAENIFPSIQDFVLIQ